jgi:Autotransporter beta-domain
MSNRWWVSGLLGLSVAVCAGSALADPMTHDGFYFRGATGLGYLHSSISAPGLDASMSGLAIGFDAWFGGSPIPGLAIGGGITTFDVPSPSLKSGGASQTFNGHAMLDIVGVFGDYYFDPNRGMHLEALLGYGVLGRTDNNGNSSNNDPSGLALGVGFGNDWWVSDEWSIGVLGRLIYAPLSYSIGSVSEKYSTITPAVMATFTYH